MNGFVLMRHGHSKKLRNSCQKQQTTQTLISKTSAEQDQLTLVFSLRLVVVMEIYIFIITPHYPLPSFTYVDFEV